MCYPIYVNFSSQAPDEFKKVFLTIYKTYVISSILSSYSPKIGLVLAIGIAGIQTSLKAYYFNSQIDSILSTSILIISAVMGVVSGISFLFKRSREKYLGSLLKYTTYFNTIPEKDVEEGEQELNTVVGFSLSTAERLAALKYHFYR